MEYSYLQRWKVAAHASVTSTLDYGNSLLYGLPSTKLRKLQMIQNVSARVLIQAKKYDRISMTAVRKKKKISSLATN